MMQVQIDNLTPGDISRVAEMVGSLAFFRSYGYEPDWIEKLLRSETSQRSSEFLVATRAGRPVGVAWFVPRGCFARSGYLRLMAVANDEQRRGVGRRLIEALEERFLAPEGITLLVTEDNQTACRFYERLGYRRVGSIPGYVRPDRTECIYFKSGR